MISRYLVINDDLLCNVFTLQSVWIHYKENRYPLTGITVFNAQNCGIHQSGITVLCFRNDGSESSGILNQCYSSSEITLIIREELLFEKISVIIVNSGILNNSSRIIFYFLFRKSGILVLTSFTSTLLPNHVSFHSLSFLSTDSCDISA